MGGSRITGRSIGPPDHPFFLTFKSHTRPDGVLKRFRDGGPVLDCNGTLPVIRRELCFPGEVPDYSLGLLNALTPVNAGMPVNRWTFCPKTVMLVSVLSSTWPDIAKRVARR